MTALFEFKQSMLLLKSTGKKARTLAGLREVIATVSAGSIFHHRYQYFLKGHILEYANDFSHWAGESIEERALAEQLSNIEPCDFADIDQLRNVLVRTIDRYRERFPEPREALDQGRQDRWHRRGRGRTSVWHGMSALQAETTTATAGDG